MSDLYECPACGATGLYQGAGERDGFVVVCHMCNGTGGIYIKNELPLFAGRKNRKALRVLHVNPGITAGIGKGVDGRELGPEDFGGLTLEQWRDGEPFTAGTEMRQFTCPAWWYQSADYRLKPRWDECEFGEFARCSHFPRKAECWARWDRENPGAHAEQPDGSPERRMRL